MTTLTIAAIFLAGVGLAGLDTASNSLVVAMLGPQRAPPFTQVNRKYCYLSLLSLPSHFTPWSDSASFSALCWSDPSSLTPGDVASCHLKWTLTLCKIIREGEDNSQVCDGFNSSSVIRRNVTLKDAEDDDLNPSEYQLLMDDEEPGTEIPNLIYPFTIIMTICTVSTAAYLSLSKKDAFHCLKNVTIFFFSLLQNTDAFLQSCESGRFYG